MDRKRKNAADLVIMMNPDIPLAFECMPSSTENRDVAHAGVDAESCNRQDFVSETAMEAHEIVLEAYEYIWSEPEVARGFAEEALEVVDSNMDLCPEAANVFAYTSETYESALEYFQIVATKALSAPIIEPRVVEKAKKEKAYWAYPCLRPYQRGLQGAALTLVKMERWSQAYKIYQILKKIDGAASTNSSTYANWRYHVPLVLVKMKQYDRAVSWMSEEGDSYLMSNTQLAFIATAAWIQYELGKVGDVDFELWNPRLQEQRYQRTERGAASRLVQFVEFLQLLKKNEPGEPQSALYLGGYQDVDADRAKLYWWRYGQLWRERPEHAQKLFAFANRVELHSMLSTPEPPSVKAVRELFADDAGVPNKYVAGHPLVDIVVGSSRWPAEIRIEIVRILAEHGFNTTRPNRIDRVTSLQKASYWSTQDDCELIDILIQSGADPTDRAVCGMSPLMMAANQGNLPALKVLMKYTEEAKGKVPSIMLSDCLKAAAESSVFSCIMGTGPFCERCRGDKAAHTPDIFGVPDFEGVIDFLLDSNIKKQHVLMAVGSGHTKKLPLGKYALMCFQGKREKGSALRDDAPIKETLDVIKSRFRPTKPLRGSSVEREYGSAPVMQKKKKKKKSGPCVACQKLATKQCGRCKKAFFCNVHCQKVSWGSHKKVCKPA